MLGKWDRKMWCTNNVLCCHFSDQQTANYLNEWEFGCFLKWLECRIRNRFHALIINTHIHKHTHSGTRKKGRAQPQYNRRKKRKKKAKRCETSRFSTKQLNLLSCPQNICIMQNWIIYCRTQKNLSLFSFSMFNSIRPLLLYKCHGWPYDERFNKKTNKTNDQYGKGLNANKPLGSDHKWLVFCLFYFFNSVCKPKVLQMQ